MNEKIKKAAAKGKLTLSQKEEIVEEDPHSVLYPDETTEMTCGDIMDQFIQLETYVMMVMSKHLDLKKAGENPKIHSPEKG